ncbi:uncharacterized protein PG986_008605 [Apiospora aurea]|uniref:Uncharacterized protein n=1 Tax=Apiospora aurea TaxID=335848 RepID=A0ABR1Q5A6_9PEZI
MLLNLWRRLDALLLFRFGDGHSVAELHLAGVRSKQFDGIPVPESPLPPKPPLLPRGHGLPLLDQCRLIGNVAGRAHAREARDPAQTKCPAERSQPQGAAAPHQLPEPEEGLEKPEDEEARQHRREHDDPVPPRHAQVAA